MLTHKYGICFINFNFSDINLLKLFYSKICTEEDLLEQIYFQIPTINSQFSFLGSKPFIIWFAHYEICYKTYLSILKSLSPHSIYDIELTELTKGFELLESETMFNLLGIECVGVIVDTQFFTTSQFLFINQFDAAYYHNSCLMTLGYLKGFINQTLNFLI